MVIKYNRYRMNYKLPSSIISLIHYSKLNERGWWEKSISNIIIGVIAEKDNLPASKEDIFKRLIDCQINIDSARFDKQFRNLIETKQLINHYDNSYMVSDEANNKFIEAYKNQVDVEIYAKNKFLKLLVEKGSSNVSEQVWNNFNQNLLDIV